MAIYKTQKLFITKEELETLYLKDMMSIRAIGRKYKCDGSIILRRLKKYNIPRRPNTNGWLKASERKRIIVPPGFRHCCSCKQQLPVSNFYTPKDRNRSGFCRPCHRIYERKRAQILKLKAIEYLGSKCKNCGFNQHIAAFDFHHRDRTTKELNWNKLRNRKWDKIKLELDKCDLLCSNCHRVHHATEGDLHIDH